MKVSFDTREVRRLIVDLEKQPIKKTKKFERVVDDGAGALALLWKQEARESNPRGHAKRYIPSINYRRVGLTATVGPYADRVGGRMKQGFMAFEYGDHNHPPQLNGNRAADRVFPAFRKRALDAAELDL